MAQFGEGTGPIHLSGITCNGSESSLLTCDYTENTTICDHGDDVGVQCSTTQCTNGKIRLVNGLSNLEGRVEICVEGVWGTICDNNFDVNDARVICRQLEYPYQSMKIGKNKYHSKKLDGK